MDPLRQLIIRIQAQLGELNRSQQMVIGLCAVLIAGSLLWLTRWSAEPVYVSLLPNQPMTTQQIDRLVDVLRTSGADYQAKSDRILVRAEERPRLISVLNMADALPADLEITFASLMEDDSPFRPESENASRRNIALGNELAKIIAASSDVAAARVLVQPMSRRALGGGSIRASASVSVTMASGRQLTNDRVRGMARLVAGAVAGLEPHMVSIMDGRTGRPWIVPHPDDETAFGMLEERKKHENHLLAKIMEQLAYIPGVLVAVSLEFDSDQSQTTSTTWGEPAIKQDSTTETETDLGRAASGPGTSANVGMALSQGGSTQRSTSSDSTTSYYEPRLVEQVQTKTSPFGIKRVTASVNVPRSYVASIFKATTGSEAEPSDADLDPLKTTERARIQGLVQNVLMTTNAGDVQIDFYYDLMAGDSVFAGSPGGLAAAEIGSGGDMWSMVKAGGPQVVLGLLGLVGMMAMVRMVRKSAQIAEASRSAMAPEEGTDMANTDEGVLAVDGGPVGMAGISDGYLVGQEVDEDTLRGHELREQVSAMVTEDPDGAADLVRRWVEQT